MKSRLLVAVCACICVLTVPSYAWSQTLLLSHPVPLAEGYSGPTWGIMDAVLDAATNNGIEVVSYLDDLNQMLTYDAIWVDTRGPTGTLSTTEIANITNFISTGRRVVMMGENDSWADWNNQILGIVGGSYLGDSNVNPLSPITANQLTAGVGSVVAPAHGVALGGDALFSDNFATLWNDSVLTILDVDAFNDTYWNEQDNAVFAQNVAGWVAASPVPIPPAVWLFGSGLLGLVGMARRRPKAA